MVDFGARRACRMVAAAGATLSSSATQNKTGAVMRRVARPGRYSGIRRATRAAAAFVNGWLFVVSANMPGLRRELT